MIIRITRASPATTLAGDSGKVCGASPGNVAERVHQAFLARMSLSIGWDLHNMNEVKIP